jgi:DNA invertase Pin-like site-specific DNA recombinase
MTRPTPTAGTPRALLYVRVSTEEQSLSALGQEAQIATLTAEAERRGWEIEVISEVGSGKSLTGRPLLREALDRLDRGEAQILAAARIDRVARHTADALAIVERADRHRWDLVTLGEGSIDTSTPAGRFALTIVAAAAQLERDLIAARTREALAAKRARGEEMGRPVTLAPEVRDRIGAEWAAGRNLTQIAEGLAADGIPTARGGIWRPNTIKRVLASLALEAERAEARRLAGVAG